MDVVLPELVSCELHRYGLIEPGLTRFFLDVVAPGLVVYDVGAHLGYFSLLAGFLGATVYSFEPSMHTLPLLRRNVGDGAVVVPMGVWSEETALDFKDFGPAHSAVNTYLSPKDKDVAEPERIYSSPVTTIDAYARLSTDIPDVIKVDAEGAEIEVFRGALATISSRRPLISIEVGDSNGSETSRRAIDVAASFGYEPFDMTVGGRTPHVPRDTYSYGNVLLVPAEDVRPDLSRRRAPTCSF